MIDVAWVDRDGVVQRVRAMAPGRVSGWSPRAAGVLETEAGACARWGLAVGTVVDLPG